MAVVRRVSGYGIGPLPHADDLMRHLEEGATTGRLPLADYVLALDAMPPAFVESMRAQWGNPEAEAEDDAFTFPVVRAKHLIVACRIRRSRVELRQCATSGG